MNCVTCLRPFDFLGGERAMVLRHVAYGYDFVHSGACLEAACESIFAEPGYDSAAFMPDASRGAVTGAIPLGGGRLLLRFDRGGSAVVERDADEPGAMYFEPSSFGAEALAA